MDVQYSPILEEFRAESVEKAGSGSLDLLLVTDVGGEAVERTSQLEASCRPEVAYWPPEDETDELVMLAVE
jgi:hypothetical protein